MDDSEKGICRLSVVPIREKPSDHAIMCSELLFGEHYTVLKNEDGWKKIQLHFDQSEGWIASNQHTKISEDYYKQINLSDYKVCTDISGTIFFQKKHVHILLGSILPITTNELFKLEEQVAFNGESKSLSRRREFEFLKETVKQFLHAPYLTGGKTPFGIDEGGFIQQVLKISGYRLPRTIKEQAKVGESVENQNDLYEGDLLFGKIGNRKTGLIYLGENKYVGVWDGEVRKVGDISIFKGKFQIRRIILKNITSEVG